MTQIIERKRGKGVEKREDWKRGRGWRKGKAWRGEEIGRAGYSITEHGRDGMWLTRSIVSVS